MQNKLTIPIPNHRYHCTGSTHNIYDQFLAIIINTNFSRLNTSVSAFTSGVSGSSGLRSILPFGGCMADCSPGPQFTCPWKRGCIDNTDMIRVYSLQLCKVSHLDQPREIFLLFFVLPPLVASFSHNKMVYHLVHLIDQKHLFNTTKDFVFVGGSSRTVLPKRSYAHPCTQRVPMIIPCY